MYSSLPPITVIQLTINVTVNVTLNLFCVILYHSMYIFEIDIVFILA
jgi:hypothetical protein